MSAIQIETVDRPSMPGCLVALSRAFESDPVARWVFPDPAAYAECFPEVGRAFLEGALPGGTALKVRGLGATAVWLGPGTGPDESVMDSALGQGVEPARRPAVLDFLGQMSALHPLEPHWYLPLIGVEPSLQGRGLGSALLAQATRACDGLGLPAYLEATCPTNVALYLRHGFVPLGTIQVDDSPPLTRMRREPRGLPDRRR